MKANRENGSFHESLDLIDEKSMKAIVGGWQIIGANPSTRPPPGCGCGYYGGPMDTVGYFQELWPRTMTGGGGGGVN